MFVTLTRVKIGSSPSIHSIATLCIYSLQFQSPVGMTNILCLCSCSLQADVAVHFLAIPNNKKMLPPSAGTMHAG